MKDKVFIRGMIDGLPIGMGYFAVAFSLGITAQSIGFDALSHIKSFSTSDFWNGIFKDSHKIHNFSGSELSPLLQLFSDSLKEQLKELYLYKNSNSDILLSFEEITSL